MRIVKENYWNVNQENWNSSYIGRTLGDFQPVENDTLKGQFRAMETNCQLFLKDAKWTIFTMGIAEDYTMPKELVKPLLLEQLQNAWRLPIKYSPFIVRPPKEVEDEAFANKMERFGDYYGIACFKHTKFS